MSTETEYTVDSFLNEEAACLGSHLKSLADVSEALKKVKTFCDKIPSPNDHIYFKSFPEFSTLSSDVVIKSLMMIQRIMNIYFPTLSEDLLENDNLSSVEDFQLFHSFISSIYGSIGSLMKEGGNIVIKDEDETGNQFFKSLDNGCFEFLPCYVSSVMEKPQKQFKTIVSSDCKNFSPILKVKHNAKKDYVSEPCNIVPNMFLLEEYARQIGMDVQNSELHSYVNPYAYEINHIVYPDFEDKEPISISQPGLLESSPYIIVNTEDQLEQLIQSLSQEDIIGFDIREHSYRSYLGFICIITICTYTCDYIIDTIQLYDNVWKLNEVFTNEHIMKVFSGDEHIITSLQRDFGIYCVNVFSLIQAARVLSLSSYCIPTLIEKYCGLTVCGLPSTCDWRVRPLSTVYINDCRCISHYLIYLSAVMRKELIKASPPGLNLIYDVLARGNEACLVCYEKPLYSYQKGNYLIPKMGLLFTKKQRTLFLALTYWRDIVARVKDESPQYILPLHCIIDIVQANSAKEIPSIFNHYEKHLQEFLPEVEKVYYTINVIEESEMGAYAVAVEGLCGNYLNCPITSCKNFLSDSCVVDNVSLGRITEEGTNENEPFPCTTLESSLQRLINHGTFKYVHPKENKEEGYLYYNPNSLPFNPTAPLRNTVPYIPIDITDDHIQISSLVPPEYIHHDIRKYIEQVNNERTSEDVEEMRFIREGLGLDSVTKNLMMLGSVLDDDAISLSSDDDDMEISPKGSGENENEEYIPHYPPRTLKEIYSLPHKNRGDLKDGLNVSTDEISKVINVIQENELPQEELEDLLKEGNTANKTDMEFLREIGWTTKADELESVFRDVDRTDELRVSSMNINENEGINPAMPGLMSQNRMSGSFMSGMNQGMSGMNQGMSGMNQNKSGMNQNKSGMNQNKSGMNQNMPGMNLNMPGMNQNIPGMNQNMPGMNLNMPGMNLNMPGMNQNMQKDGNRMNRSNRQGGRKYNGRNQRNTYKRD